MIADVPLHLMTQASPTWWPKRDRWRLDLKNNTTFTNDYKNISYFLQYRIATDLCNHNKKCIVLISMKIHTHNVVV